MAELAYPLLHPRRRRRPRISAAGRRVAIVGLGGAVALAGGALWLARPAAMDQRVMLGRSLAALEAGDYSGARDRAIAAAAADGSRRGIAQAVLARAWLELDDGVAAEAALDRAAAAGVPAARLHQLRAQARLLQGDSGGAMAEAEAAVPRYASYAARVSARATAAAGDGAAARRMLEVVVAGAPQDGAAWTDLAQLRLTAGDVGGAAVAAGEAAKWSPRDPRMLVLAAAIVRSRFGPVAALPWLEAALRRDPCYAPALIDAAAVLGELGRTADMLAMVRRAAAARPGEPRGYYLRAVLAARAGRFDLAGDLLAKGGGGPAGTLLAGGIDYAAGRYEQAAATWRGLNDVQPMNLAVRRLLAAALLRAGDARGSLAVLRPLAMRGDADAYSLTLAARGFEAIGDRATAAQLLDRAQRGARGGSGAFATDESVAALAAGAAATPGDPTYVVGLLRGMVGAGDRAGAVWRAQTLAAASPGAPDAQLALGDVQVLAGRDPRGAYARAADLRFDEPAMLRLIDAQARAGRARDAAATLALYLSQNPRSVTGLRLLGHWQLEAGETGAAVATLEAVRRRVGGGDVALLVDLALAYAGEEDGAAALRYARAGYALAPMNARAADAYAVALATAGRIGAARQLIAKARTLAPGDPAIAAHARELG